MKRQEIQWLYRLFFLMLLGCQPLKDVEEPCLDDCDWLELSARDYESAWGPDGAWIAFVRGDVDINKHGIWMMSPDGSGKRQLTFEN